MTHVEEFQDEMQNELQHVLTKPFDNNNDSNYSVLCLNQLSDMESFATIVDSQTPFYLHVGRMTDLEFTLFSDKIAVGPAPLTNDRKVVWQQLEQQQANPPVNATIYQVIYQIAGHPAPQPQLGTFWDAPSSADSAVSPQVCLHRAWGALDDLPPEMAAYIRTNVKPLV